MDNLCYITDDISQYHTFTKRSGINMRLYMPTSLDDMIFTINSCKLYIGNASFPLTIAHALHKDNIILIDSPLISTFFSGIDVVIPNTKLILPPTT